MKMREFTHTFHKTMQSVLGKILIGSNVYYYY